MTRRNPVVGRQQSATSGFTLIEMLIAMAITLVMIAAVVTLFANISATASAIAGRWSK